MEQDLSAFTEASALKGVDIVSGGLPCPPFSKAGKQLGHNDERNLFPAAINLVDQLRPRAVMIENVRGILDAVFEDYRNTLLERSRNSDTSPTGGFSMPRTSACPSCARAWFSLPS